MSEVTVVGFSMLCAYSHDGLASGTVIMSNLGHQLTCHFQKVTAQIPEGGCISWPVLCSYSSDGPASSAIVAGNPHHSTRTKPIIFVRLQYQQIALKNSSVCFRDCNNPGSIISIKLVEISYIDIKEGCPLQTKMLIKLRFLIWLDSCLMKIPLEGGTESPMSTV